MALSPQVKDGSASGEALRHEYYKEFIDRDTILIDIDFLNSEQKIDTTIARELRHLWQFKNNFQTDDYTECEMEKWKLASQEIDADAFALAFFQNFPHENISDSILEECLLPYDMESEAYKKRVELAKKISEQLQNKV